MSASISYRRYIPMRECNPLTPNRTLAGDASPINTGGTPLPTPIYHHRANSINTTKHINGSLHRPMNVNQLEYTEREFLNMSKTSVFQ